MKIKVAMVSLGCPKNLVDAERMTAVLQNRFEVLGDVLGSDVVIINTCGFIESAKQEAIDVIFEMGALKANGEIRGIVVTGCLAERYKEELAELLPEVDAFVGAGSIFNIEEAVIAANKNERYMSYLPMCDLELGGKRALGTPFYTAYLKISDGCDNRCAYCAIPLIRGDLRSRPLEDLLEEAKELASGGVREIILVAQDTTVYGKDIYGEAKICELIRGIAKIEGIEWIRLLYCYPDKISEELCDLFEFEKKLLPYIDLPLQHASDHMLSSMNRKGGASLLRTVLTRLRKIPDMCIRTTFICGFPGETEQDHEILMDFVRDFKFDRMGSFAFSKEEGTAAFHMGNQIDEAVKIARVADIMKLQEGVSKEINKSLEGRKMTVLVEGFDAEISHYFGRSYRDAPDIDGTVYFYLPETFNGKEPAIGEFVEVLIKSVEDHDLFAVITTQ